MVLSVRSRPQLALDFVSPDRGGSSCRGEKDGNSPRRKLIRSGCQVEDGRALRGPADLSLWRCRVALPSKVPEVASKGYRGPEATLDTLLPPAGAQWPLAKPRLAPRDRWTLKSKLKDPEGPVQRRLRILVPFSIESKFSCVPESAIIGQRFRKS